MSFLTTSDIVWKAPVCPILCPFSAMVSETFCADLDISSPVLMYNAIVQTFFLFIKL